MEGEGSQERNSMCEVDRTCHQGVMGNPLKTGLMATGYLEIFLSGGKDRGLNGKTANLSRRSHTEATSCPSPVENATGRACCKKSQKKEVAQIKTPF